jgi:hypothetical protein
MRTKLFKIAQAATFGLAITFTLSCSGGEDPPGGGNGNNPSGSNLSDLPKQAYLVHWDNDGKIIKKDEYTGNCDITDGSISAGRIQNGQVLLDLPDIESKYLKKFEDNTRFIKCKECIDFDIPKNLSGHDMQTMPVAIPDKSNCGMKLILVGSYGRERRDVLFYYSSESAKMNGTSCSYFEDGTCYGGLNLNLNLSKGWNALYGYDDVNANRTVITTDLSETGGTLEWQITCDN